jgi:hypothetical protein
LTVTTECIATYSVTDSNGTKLYKEHFNITQFEDETAEQEGHAV